MKIQIEVDDLTTFAKALNNAVIAYDDIVVSILLKCKIGVSENKFKTLTKLSDKELESRRDTLLQVYRQIEKLEKEMEGEKK